MAIDINIPSQVKTYANLAAFPATGSLKTIFIAEDTNKTYRWTGSAYVEVSSSQAAAWGTITGTLSAQTDLNTALSGKVPTTRTLTINGTTQDLSADRTFTVSTGITIGTTAITSGTVGRVLFEGTGNVVQESANLFWDNTNGRLGVGTSSPSNKLDISGNATGGNPTRLGITNTGASGVADLFAFNDTGRFLGLQMFGSTATSTFAGINNANLAKFVTNNTFVVGTSGSNPLVFAVNGSVLTGEVARFSTNSNFLINTTTDAGFKLDVNGTARVSGNTVVTTWIGVGGVTTPSGTGEKFNVQGAQVISGASGASNFLLYQISGASRFIVGSEASIGGTANNYINYVYGNNSYITYTNNVARLSVTGGGNVLINTTTDAGFKLDVNGTARISVATGTLTNQFTIISSSSRLDISAYDSSTYGVILRPSVNNGGAFVPLSLWGSKIQLETSSTVHISAAATGGNASAILDVTSTTKGFLPPRMTTTQKNAIASPATGLMVYDTTLNVITYYNGTTWI